MKAIVIGEMFGGETATGGLIENYPGYPEIDGYDLMMKFREQSEKYEFKFVPETAGEISTPPFSGLRVCCQGQCADHHSFGGQPGAVDGHRQAEVANLGYTIAGEPDVARFQVSVDYATTVRELQATAGLFSDFDRLFQRQAVVGGVLNDSFHVTATHQLGNHVGLALMLPQVKHRNDVRVGAKSAHGLGLTRDAGTGDIV
jgi:hypothetical protein